MPELPEVETIRKELASEIINQKIHDCIIIRPDVIAHPDPKTFRVAILNEEIIDVTRQGKYLILLLTHDKRLIFHLRLSGTIAIRDRSTAPERFTRVAIVLDAFQLFFNEPRVLGRAYVLVGDEQSQKLKGLYSLGYEPISPEFDFTYFRQKVKGRKARIKSLLLDQRICAGVGNIYSDEALFRAGIRPLRRAYRITTEETFKLLSALKDVLREAIVQCGTSVAEYKRTDGTDGGFQNFLFVYGREHEPCRRCGSPIQIKKIGNRSTRYCPKCQK
jgi:formamidopyrimidine-DNA glycosylase